MTGLSRVSATLHIIFIWIVCSRPEVASPDNGSSIHDLEVTSVSETENVADNVRKGLSKVGNTVDCINDLNSTEMSNDTIIDHTEVVTSINKANSIEEIKETCSVELTNGTLSLGLVNSDESVDTFDDKSYGLHTDNGTQNLNVNTTGNEQNGTIGGDLFNNSSSDQGAEGFQTCTKSCVDRCDMKSDDSQECSCSSECLFYGDCCFDFFKVCHNTSEDELEYALNFTLLNDTIPKPAVPDDHWQGVANIANCKFPVHQAMGSKNLTEIFESVGCLDCVSTKSRTSDNFYYISGSKMVSICPQSWTDIDVRKSCENQAPTFDNPPFHDSVLPWVSYRNIHCAQCHGRSFNLLRPWNVSLKCPQTKSLEDRIQNVDFLKRYCFFEFQHIKGFMTESCFLHCPVAGLHGANTKVPCSIQVEGLEDRKAKKDNNKLQIDSGKLLNSTNRHVTSIKVKRSLPSQTDSIGNVYHLLCRLYGRDRRNRQCWCSERTNTTEEIPDSQGLDISITTSDPLVPLSVLFALDDSYRIRIVSVETESNISLTPGMRCDGDQVYSPLDQNCVKVECPAGQRYQHGACAEDALKLLSKEGNYTKVLLLHVGLSLFSAVKNPRPPQAEPFSKILQCVFQEFDGKINIRSFESRLKSEFTLTDGDERRIETCDIPQNISKRGPEFYESADACGISLKSIYKFYEDIKSIQLCESIADANMTVKLMTNEWAEIEQFLHYIRKLTAYPFLIPIVNGTDRLIFFKYFKVTNFDPALEMGCSGSSFIKTENFTYLFDDERLVVNFSDTSLNKAITMARISDKFSFSWYNCTGAWERRTVATACGTVNKTDLYNCSVMLGFRHNSYTFAEDKGVSTYINNTEYRTRVFQNSSNLVLICSKNLKKISSREVLDYSEAEIMLGYICRSASLVGLVLTLFTYSVFKKLRNVPGKIVICLSACLLVGMILSLLTGEFKGHWLFCPLSAGLLQYFFLGAFCWMNTLAMDIARSFSQAVMPSDEEKRKAIRFRLYCVYAITLPLLFTVAPIVTEYIRKDLVDWTYLYDTKQYCWLHKDFRYYFYVPVMLLLVLNIVLFVRSVKSIRSVSKITKTAKIKSREDGNVVLCLKLSLVMGLPWLLTFVGSYSGRVTESVLSLLNSLQGVFIFVTFVCNSRVVRLYKAKFSKMWRDEAHEKQSHDITFTFKTK